MKNPVKTKFKHQLTEELNQKFSGSLFYRPLGIYVNPVDVGYFVFLNVKESSNMLKVEVFLINKNKIFSYHFGYDSLVSLKETNTIWWNSQENGEIWATKVS